MAAHILDGRLMEMTDLLLPFADEGADLSFEVHLDIKRQEQICHFHKTAVEDMRSHLLAERGFQRNFFAKAMYRSCKIVIFQTAPSSLACTVQVYSRNKLCEVAVNL